MRFTLLRSFKEGNAILLINIAAIAFLVWILTLWAGQLISAKMVSLPTYAPPRPNAGIITATVAADYSSIKHRNLFYPLAQQSPSAAAGEMPISSLPYKLVGTIISHNAKDNAAILEAGAKEQSLFRINDSLLKGAFITQINRFEVIVSNNGRLERIPINFGDIQPANDKGRQAFGGLPAGTQVSMLGDNQIVMDKRFFESQKTNMNELLTNIRAVPNAAADGSINGFQLFEIVKDSLYDKIGLKNQDVVQRVNGQALTSMEGGLDLFNALKNDNHFVIDVIRNNQSKTLTVDVQ